jgi:hypothetical protein
MRFMITCRIPVEKGNELVKTGTLAPTVQSIMEDLKPEAAYFVDVDGARGAHIVVDMEEASQIPPLGGTPHARVGGRDRGPHRDGLGGLGQGERGVRASGPEVRLSRSTCLVASGPGSHGALALLIATIHRSARKRNSRKSACKAFSEGRLPIAKATAQSSKQKTNEVAACQSTMS